MRKTEMKRLALQTRFWLMRLLAGGRTVVMNAKITGSTHVETSGAVVSNCKIIGGNMYGILVSPGAENMICVGNTLLKEET